MRHVQLQLFKRYGSSQVSNCPWEDSVMPQRWGGLLEMEVHLHACVPPCVYVQASTIRGGQPCIVHYMKKARIQICVQKNDSLGWVT